MKATFLQACIVDGRERAVGDEITIEDAQGKEWVRAGLLEETIPTAAEIPPVSEIVNSVEDGKE